ncbi:uncharacterized protein LOC135276535 [Aotus nancymaae]|uniref:uncharacterized protein LOC135276534 n=1 Tax=Aotus nancymaae TaxID=37293 RepID=UPI0030FE0F51
MGNQESHPDPKSPLGCLVLNLPKLGLSIKKKRLLFLSTVAWPRYPLNNQSKWPPESTLDVNVLTDLDNFCQRNGKWAEVPYIQAFWYLRAHPDLCSSCDMAQVLLAKNLPKQPSAPQATSSSSFSDPDLPEELSLTPTRPNNPPPYAEPQTPPASPGLDLTSPVSIQTRSHSIPTNGGSLLCPLYTKSRIPSAPPLSKPQPPPAFPGRDVAPPASAHIRLHGASTDENSLLCPLREVAGTEGVVRVHIPFSLSDLSTIEKCLGSFSANPTVYTKEFCYLTQAYDLTWHDIYVILTSTLTPDEHDCIHVAARAHADQVHLTDPQMPIGTAAVPDTNPNRDYQTGQNDRRRRDQMLQCLLADMQGIAQKVVNYDKLREITQGPTENPAAFFDQLTNAMVLHTRVDPNSPAGTTLLAAHFISQSTPDIRKKLKKAEEGPQTPIRDLVNLAFKVFNGREEKAEAVRQAHLQQQVSLKTQAIVAALRPAVHPASGGRNSSKFLQKGPLGPAQTASKVPPGPCFKCGQEGHWARQCPCSHPPPGPCPICKQTGHWKDDCPHRTMGSPPAPLCGGQASPKDAVPSLELLGLMDD